MSKRKESNVDVERNASVDKIRNRYCGDEEHEGDALYMSEGLLARCLSADVKEWSG